MNIMIIKLKMNKDKKYFILKIECNIISNDLLKIYKDEYTKYTKM